MARLARATLLLLLLGAALLACKKKSADEGEATAASAAPPAATAVGTVFNAGDQVDVEWKGEWWKALVTQVSAGPRYKIHYVGWSESWDEVVGPERIRPRTEGSRTQ